MEFHIKASTLRKDYIEFIAPGDYKDQPWNVYLCLFIEFRYNRSTIDDNKKLLVYIPDQYVARGVRFSRHGVQGFVTQEFCQQMVDAGCEVMAWPSKAAHEDHFDWDREARVAFRVGLLSYIIQQHGDLELSFSECGDDWDDCDD